MRVVCSRCGRPRADSERVRHDCGSEASVADCRWEGDAPEYLAELPGDPFADEARFGYAPRGTEYVLYGVGPDGEDNGGRPVEDQSADEPSPDRYKVQTGSTGDIVAGVNVR